MGYHAEVLHEHAGCLWGPLPVGGVAAWVADTPDDGGDEPAARPRVRWLPVEVGTTLAGVILAVVAACLAGFLFNWLRQAVWYPREALSWIGGIAVWALVVAGMGSMLGWILSCWLHRIWDPGHPQHPPASGIHRLLACLLLFAATPVGAVVWWLLPAFGGV